MKLTHTNTTKLKNKGFTLIELLVSMTVTMMIIGVLMAMTRVAVDGMVSAQNATRSSRLSNEVMSTVGRDLEGIVIRNGNNFEWVSVKESDVASDDTRLGPDGDDNKQLKNPIELNFFSAVTDRYNGNKGSDKGGDVSFMRYKIVYEDTLGETSDSDFSVFSLFRYRIDPDDAFSTYLAQTELGAFDEEITGNHLLAENIYDMNISFNFEFLKSDGTSLYKRIPVLIDGQTTALSITGNGLYLNGSETVYEHPDADAGPARLSSADISIMVLSDAGMKGLKNANISGADELSEYLKKHGKLYTESVVLPRP